MLVKLFYSLGAPLSKVRFFNYSNFMKQLQTTRNINQIVIHCSDTEEHQDFSVSDIDLWHKRRGWRCVGYHFVIPLSGKLEEGRPLSEPGAHALHYNQHSIGICYIGGVRRNRPADTRTPAQRLQMEIIVKELLKHYPEAKVCGHRDLSEDLDGNGVVSSGEWQKTCPNFDVSEWARSVGIPSKNILIQ